MGMDCIPENDIEPFHCNWNGWHFLRRVLELSGADTSVMSESNNGYPVRAETAAAWAKALRRKLAERGPLRLKLAKVPNKIFMNGYEEVPVLEFEKLPTQTKVFMKLKFGTTASIAEQVRSYMAVEIIFGYQLDESKISVTELNKDTRKFVRKFAEFCERSGGFRQF
jgi:hypothetical protein